MMQSIKPDFVYADERGKLVQLCKSGYGQVNVLYCKANSVRGMHYHKINEEAFFVVSGSVVINVTCNENTGEMKHVSGDFFSIKPLVRHSLYFPEDTVLVALYSQCIELSPGVKDIYV